MVEQQLELIRNLSKGVEQKSLSAISNILHPDYVRVTRPQSVNVPKRNKAQYLEYLGKIFENWAKVEPANLTALANTPGKVIVHITCDVTLKSGSVVAYESVVDYHIDEDPSGNMKIKYAEEFIDANAYANGYAPPAVAATT